MEPSFSQHLPDLPEQINQPLSRKDFLAKLGLGALGIIGVAGLVDVESNVRRKYTKPADGVPVSDLSPEVRAALRNARDALSLRGQSLADITPRGGQVLAYDSSTSTWQPSDSGGTVSGVVGLKNAAGGRINPATEEKQNDGNTKLGTLAGTVKDGKVQVDASVDLPSGAATEAKQDVGNTSLDSIDTKTPDKGQANMAGSTPVVIASDQTDVGTKVNNGSGANAVNIQDGGNSITVDGTVAATQSGTWNVNNVSGTVSLPTGASTSAKQSDGSQKTQVVDGSGNVIGSTSNALDVNIKSNATGSVTPGTGAANLGKAEDAPHVSGDTGVMSLGVRNDNAITLTDTDGDYSPIAVDSAGRIRLAAAKNEDAAHTSGDTGFMVLGIRQSTPTDLSAGNTNGDYEPFQVDANGALYVTQATKVAGEDQTNDVMKVEQQMSYNMVTADTLIKSGAGFIHTITFACNDSAPTAGNLDIYDNTTNSGTKIFSTAFTTTFFMPLSVTINSKFNTGLYADFTTTADVNVTISYR